MANCITLTSLSKITAGSINGGESEGNITTAKKITLFNGEQLPYVSGQSIRRMMRDRMAEAGEMLSPLNLTEENAAARAEKAPKITDGNPREYIDDDVFGFLQAVSGKTRRRTAPVRVSVAAGIFPYSGDRDYGTKSKGYEANESGQNLTGNIFETEIYSNIFRNTIMIELDRLGVFQAFETPDTKVDNLDSQERNRRLSVVIDSYLNLWGGGKQSRFLTDIGPKIVFYTKQKIKNPIFLESVLVDENNNLLVEPIIETIKEFKGCIETLYIGIRAGFVSNESFEKLKEETGKLFPNNNGESKIAFKISSLADIKEKINEDIKSIYGDKDESIENKS